MPSSRKEGINSHFWLNTKVILLVETSRQLGICRHDTYSRMWISMLSSDNYSRYIYTISLIH